MSAAERTAHTAVPPGAAGPVHVFFTENSGGRIPGASFLRSGGARRWGGIFIFRDELVRHDIDNLTDNRV